MAIIIRFLGVVIPIANIEKCNTLGGWKGILEKQKQRIGKNILYDEYLYKDGAMGSGDIEDIVDFWERQGFVSTETKDGKTYWKDLCVVDCVDGPTMPCEWLSYARYDGGGMCVWLKDEYMGRVIRPTREAGKSVQEQLAL